MAQKHPTLPFVGNAFVHHVRIFRNELCALTKGARFCVRVYSVMLYTLRSVNALTISVTLKEVCIDCKQRNACTLYCAICSMLCAG